MYTSGGIDFWDIKTRGTYVFLPPYARTGDRAVIKFGAKSKGYCKHKPEIF